MLRAECCLLEAQILAAARRALNGQSSVKDVFSGMLQASSYDEYWAYLSALELVCHEIAGAERKRAIRASQSYKLPTIFGRQISNQIELKRLALAYWRPATRERRLARILRYCEA